jgi:hypothetical protein
MPFPLNYGSTGRPPGEYHLRHSFKEITDNLEFPPPPFDIFFIELNNRNNNNHSIIYYNGGIVDDDKDKDIKDGGPYGTRRIGTAVALDLDNWSLNQMTSNNNNNNNNNNNIGPSMPTNCALPQGSGGPFESICLDLLISKRTVQGMTTKTTPGSWGTSQNIPSGTLPWQSRPAL